MQGAGKRERDHYTAHSVRISTKLAFWVVETGSHRQQLAERSTQPLWTDFLPQKDINCQEKLKNFKANLEELNYS